MSHTDDNEGIVPIDEHVLRRWFRDSHDVCIYCQHFGTLPDPVPALFAYSTGMAETTTINDIVMPAIRKLYEKTGFLDKDTIMKEADLQWKMMDATKGEVNRHVVAAHLFDGTLLFILPNLQTMWSIDVSKQLSRVPEESSTEVAIRGPKDAFVEHLSYNVALVRSHLRTPTLACEYFQLGTRTMTKCALLYVSDIANEDTINRVRGQLSTIREEKILTTGNLENSLAPGGFTLFPQTDYTGRPDFAADCLLNGRFIVLLDGNPTAIIAPTNLFLLLKSPEDAYFPFLSTNLGRLLRYAGLFLTIFLPGFFIAFTTFHSDQIPFSLLATISMGRVGLPMESALEMFFIMSLMELFREAGVRLPTSIGQTLTVVGGLIIGDAAIRAGMVSPLMIVVTAITVVAGATLVNQSLTSTTILLRFVSFLLSAILGMYGFILSIILLVIYLTSFESFGVPYLAPAAPLQLKDLLRSLFKLPQKWMKRRPDYLHTRKPDKRGR
ncbi:spore germination protein [Paenibacillus sp. J5C_2022]|uniref:spore germination protein n=1 Tax=Paenibacillus sp. J5C2022 TaxID=2977129 RepID=UPI0021CE8006|nr:spore germination protein [Paenibacillus sp. J5C2022]MCU6711263.1 spore germination protein [Paenibacillus sp. J5C2022]